MASARDLVEELRELAARHAGEVTGLELEEASTWCSEVTATPGGLDGTTYELHQRYVRTAGEHVGYARSEDASEPLEELLGEAVRRSRAVAKSDPAGVLLGADGAVADGAAALAAGGGVPARGAVAPVAGGGDTALDPDAFEVPREDVDSSELVRVAREGVRLLLSRAGETKEARCTVRVLEQRRRVTNSAGLARSGSHRHCLVRLSYIAVGEREMHDVSVRSYAPEPADVDVDELVGRAVATAEGSLEGGTIESGRYPVVLSREFACRMLVGIWGTLGAEKVATGQSFLAGKVGERVASPALSVVSDWRCGCVPGAPGCLPLDAEGCARTRRAVVDAGVLAEPLSTLEWGAGGSAERRDTLGRIVPNDVVCAPGNLYVAPGDASLDELLERAGDGVYLTDISDIYHSFNFASGGVSTPCRGVRIRDGRLAEPISVVSVSDSLQSLFESVVATGRELSWCDLEDLDAYWCGAPDMLVSGMSLVGGIA